MLRVIALTLFLVFLGQADSLETYLLPSGTILTVGRYKSWIEVSAFNEQKCRQLIVTAKQGEESADSVVYYSCKEGSYNIFYSVNGFGRFLEGGSGARKSDIRYFTRQRQDLPEQTIGRPDYDRNGFYEFGFMPIAEQTILDSFKLASRLALLSSASFKPNLQEAESVIKPLFQNYWPRQ